MWGKMCKILVQHCVKGFFIKVLFRGRKYGLCELDDYGLTETLACVFANYGTIKASALYLIL